MESIDRSVLDPRLRGDDDLLYFVRTDLTAYLHGLESLTSNFPIAPEMTKSL